MSKDENPLEGENKSENKINDEKHCSQKTHGKEMKPDISEEEKIENQDFKEPREVTIKETELQFLKQEAEEYKDKYLRLLAEMENTRKRLQKERLELIQYAVQNVIVDFLNPIDHMENALNYTDQMSDQIKHWAVGFKMIMDQFKDVLVNQGVTSFKSQGTEFNPNSHEAVEMIETDEYPAGTVVEESIKGYKMGEKIIRPARVKVAKATSSPE